MSEQQWTTQMDWLHSNTCQQTLLWGIGKYGFSKEPPKVVAHFVKLYRCIGASDARIRTFGGFLYFVNSFRNTAFLLFATSLNFLLSLNMSLNLCKNSLTTSPFEWALNSIDFSAASFPRRYLCNIWLKCLLMPCCPSLPPRITPLLSGLRGCSAHVSTKNQIISNLKFKSTTVVPVPQINQLHSTHFFHNHAITVAARFLTSARYSAFEHPIEWMISHGLLDIESYHNGITIL